MPRAARTGKGLPIVCFSFSLSFSLFGLVDRGADKGGGG